MKRILIVSPHFPPTNAPDMQRVRLVLPYLEEAGWEAEVLAVCADQVAAPIDSWLESTIPSQVPIHRVKALPLKFGLIPGLGSLTRRAMRALRIAGDRILGNERFDLVYFSTTQFGVHLLGPRWLKRFGAPFALDYQDPWVNDYYRTNPHVTPPGGRLKYALADQINRRQEPKVLKVCSGITTVSANYIRNLSQRYAWFSSDLPTATLTFPADPRDFELVKSTGISQNAFTPDDGFIHWVYVGRGGADMTMAARALFRAVAESKEYHEWIDRLKIHFIGTSYAAKGQGKSSFMQAAKSEGVGAMVSEITDRLPYAESLRCLLDADALFIVGSDDSSYTASKLFPYILAEKPLLGVFHHESSAASFLRETEAGALITFESNTTAHQIATEIRTSWIDSPAHSLRATINHDRFAGNLAQNQAKQLASFWARCVEAKNSTSR